MNEALATLIRASLVLSGAILAILALRRPARQWIGPGQAYALWLIAPLALLGLAMPSWHASHPPGVLETMDHAAVGWIPRTGRCSALILAAWLAGAIASAARALFGHGRFQAAAKAGVAGPAAVGVVLPRTILPQTFRQAFTPQQRQLILAHEQTHIERNDTRAVAAAAVLQWAFWFNPLVRLAADAFRLDQELACDAAVLEAHPTARRAYAKTLIAAATGEAAPLLAACAWRGRDRHPVVVRLTALAEHPVRRRDDLGAIAMLALWILAFAGGWIEKPPNRAFDRHPVLYVDQAVALSSPPGHGLWRVAISPP